MAPRKSKTEVAEPTANPKKTKKDGPKRPLTAFIHFSQERRKTLILERPELKSQIPETSKIIGSEWKSLPDAQKEKYLKLAQADKARYEKELKSDKGAK